MPLDFQWLTRKVRKKRKKLLRFTRVSSCFPCRREKGATIQQTTTMKTTLSTSQAASLLTADNNNGFTYSGAYALCEYLEELEADTGEEIELDPVAIRCDFAEHDSLHAWARDYFSEWREDLSLPEGMAEEEEEEDAIRSYIRDNGTLIEFDGGIIVSAF